MGEDDEEGRQTWDFHTLWYLLWSSVRRPILPLYCTFFLLNLGYVEGVLTRRVVVVQDRLISSPFSELTFSASFKTKSRPEPIRTKT